MLPELESCYLVVQSVQKLFAKQLNPGPGNASRDPQGPDTPGVKGVYKGEYIRNNVITACYEFKLPQLDKKVRCENSCFDGAFEL